LRHASESEDGLSLSIAGLTLFSGDTQFDELIRSVISERSWVDRFLQNASKVEIDEAVRQKLDVPLGADDKSLLLDALNSFDTAGLLRLAAALRQGAKGDVARADLFERLANAPSVATLEPVLRKLLKEDGEFPVQLATKGALAQGPYVQELLERYGRIAQNLRRKRNALFIAQNTTNLLHVAGAVLANYRALKGERAVLDYDDLINRTVGLFQSPGASWVLYKLDGGIDHILVDEAQDTSPNQWAIINAIATEFYAGLGVERKQQALIRTVFAVGDVKQSIMSFQGARPQEFVNTRLLIEQRAQGANAKFELVELTRSFRTAPRILELVDEVFANPLASDGVMIDEVAQRHEANRNDMPGCVELWPTEVWPEILETEGWDAPKDRAAANHPAVTLARKIAARIEAWLDVRTPVFDKLTKSLRPMNAGDVMILVRRRGLLAEEIIRQLKRRSIPVAGADRLKLASHIAVMDLIALGRFALLPDDDLTLATVLKSPLCGLSEDDLLALAQPRGKRSIWSVLQDRQDDERWKVAHAFLDHVWRSADHVQPFEFYSSILTEQGGWTKILGRLGFDAADPVEEFLNAALEFGRMNTPSLEAFLHAMETAETEIKRDQDRSEGAVRILTVHGSKGLEAPIVILPDTCATPGSGQHDRDLLQAGVTPLWKLDKGRDDPVRAAARENGKLERMREYRRLLYVALTRARDRLVVCGYEGKRETVDPARWYDLVEGAMSRLKAVAFKEESGESILRYGVLAQSIGQNEMASEPKALAVDLPAWVRVLAADEPALAQMSPSRPQKLRGSAERESARNDSALDRGRVLHQIMDALSRASPDRWSGIAQSLSRELRDTEDQQAVAAEALRVRRDPSLSYLFGAGSYSEVPVHGTVTWKGCPVEISGRLDRVLVNPTEVMILEFKTDRVVPKADSAIRAAYLEQLALYRRAVSPLFPGRAVTCGILWTVEPKLTLIPSKYLDDVERVLDPVGGAS
jgi:ATP-dependent helicase/nuclease subunit A